MKKTGKAYPIKAYGMECFYVASTDGSGKHLRIELNGEVFISNYTKTNWNFVFRMPSWGNTQLIRASSGKMEYINQDYQRKMNTVTVYHET